MTVRKAYSNILSSGSMRLILMRYACLFLFLTCFCGIGNLFSQDLPEYDEIAVFLEIQGVGGNEIDALIKAEEYSRPS